LSTNRRTLFSGVLLFAPGLASGVPMRALDLYDEPQAIILRLLEAYAAGKPPSPARLPFVHRLRTALARTDLAVDPVTGSAEDAIHDIRVGPTRLSESRRGSVEARFTQAGKERKLSFDLDMTSGEWLITDIRYDSASSLRRLLQITP